jgi:hypothetical protein
VIAPLALLLAFVRRLGVNGLIGDELHYVDYVRAVLEGGDWWPWVFQQHNEHRIVALKLLIAALAGPTRWSQRAEMLCSFGLTLLLVAALYAVYRRVGGSATAAGLLPFAPLAWLACSTAQYENQLYGLMMCHYFTVACGVAALWLLGERQARWLPLAALAAVIAATSVASGLLVFPAGVAVLLGQRADWRRWLLWCGTGAATIALYFRHYLRPPHARPFDFSFQTLSEVGKLVLATAGAPLAARSLGWALVLGAAVLLLAAVALVLWWRADDEQRRRGAVAAAILLFGLGSCAMVGVGRATLLVPGDPLGSRYVTHANLVWFGAYLLVLGWATTAARAAVRIGLLAIVALGVLAADLQGVASALEWHRERALDQYVLQTADRQPDGVLARLGPSAIERPRIDYLRRARLSAFAEPMSLLMMMTPQDPVATGDIRRELPVVQTLPCPVERLHDVGVMMLPAFRPGTVPFTITVSAEGRELVRRSLTPAEITQWQWVRLPLRSSFACHGRQLRVAIESAATVPSEQVMALTVRPYYDGELAQGGVPLRDRRLALALNGYRHHVLR